MNGDVKLCAWPRYGLRAQAGRMPLSPVGSRIVTTLLARREASHKTLAETFRHGSDAMPNLWCPSSMVGRRGHGRPLARFGCAWSRSRHWRTGSG